MEAFLARQQNDRPSTPPSSRTSTAQGKKRGRKDHGEPADVGVVKNQEKKKRRVNDTSATSESKKKGKAKQHHTQIPDAHDPEDNVHAGGSQEEESARFLRTVVEAAFITAGNTVTPENQQWAPSEQAWSGTPGPPIPVTVGSSTAGLPLLTNDMSNESVLRAIQELDVNKITEVLKALSDAQNTSSESDNAFPFMNAPLNPAILASLVPPPLGQRPVSAGKILGKKTSKQTPQAPEPNATPNFPTPNAEDAYILANKWLSAKKLDDLALTRGLVYKKGKFSNIEDQQLDSAIEHYRIFFVPSVFTFEVQAKGLSNDQLLDLIFSKEDKSRDNGFWSEITAAVPLRPIISVYHHVRRKWNPMSTQGKWTLEEDDRLRQAVATVGQSWEKVSLIVGRRAPDCRDRWRNHVHDRNDNRVIGKWTKEEEDKLIQIVEEMTVKKGRTLDDEVFWGTVSDLMGNTRNRQQCRIKWTDCLSKIVKKEGANPRWNNQDAYILVHKLDSLNVRDDSEIDWKTLGDEDWNHWSAHVLQRRWFTMKKSIKGHEDMSFRDIMEILKAKKTTFEVIPKRKAKKGSTETAEN
ncbi:nucleolar protein [Moniliophthora roreri]|nr:nucleolar protein [Moniliophthora roreri]